MKGKKGNVLKAGVVIAIAMALIMPVAADVMKEITAIEKSCGCGQDGTRTMADGKTLYTADVAKMVTPMRIAGLNEDGTATEFIDYHESRQQGLDLVFDCFEPDVADLMCPDGYDGEPIGFGTCGAGEPEDCGSLRYYFGKEYHNPYATNDMEFSTIYGGNYIERLEVAWYWYVEGPGTGENMALVIKTFEDFDDTCTYPYQGEPLGSVVLIFGYEESGSSYLYTDVDLYGLDRLRLPWNGKGSYDIWLLSYEGDDPVYPDDFYLATCAQPMLWGTGTNEWPIQDTVNRGVESHQGIIQWDDVDQPNGFHEAPDECYDYTNPEYCPNPRGAMLCFYAEGEICVGDLDDDDDTDLSDLCVLLYDMGCEPPEDCPGDVDGDGYTTPLDLGILIADWGCPDGDGNCDEPAQGVIDVSVVEVDNSAVGPGNDPLESTFHGGVTHFTFDLQVQVQDPAEDWCAAMTENVLTAPGVEFFLHGLDLHGFPPDPGHFFIYPAVEFDSFWTTPELFPNTDNGGYFAFFDGSRTARRLENSCWGDIDDTGAGTFTIARFTIVVPPGGATTPAVVPAGTGGDAQVIGTLTGSTTNACTNPGCAEIAFDIIYRYCAGDINDDGITNQQDLGILLAAWDSHPGDPNWNPDADLNGDDWIHQQDLGILLADWGCGT